MLIRNDRVFPTFSAGATDARCCIGLLTADADADVMGRASWVKAPDPIFGAGDGGPIVRLSPGGHDFVRHTDDGLIVVERAPRDLAVTQFWFEARADGTEVIRSVAHPDRYLEVDGGIVKLDTTASPVRREIVRSGVKVKLADGSGYLKQAGRAVSVSPSGTTFRLS